MLSWVQFGILAVLLGFLTFEVVQLKQETDELVVEVAKLKGLAQSEIEIEEFTNQKLDYLESDINIRNHQGN